MSNETSNCKGWRFESYSYTRGQLQELVHVYLISDRRCRPTIQYALELWPAYPVSFAAELFDKMEFAYRQANEHGERPLADVSSKILSTLFGNV